MDTITSADALRAMYDEPRERTRKKQLDAIDVHARRFIERSPFVVLASSSAAGCLDASPRGGTPGFVKVSDERTLLIPDAPGNNRLDSLHNILETGQIGLLFVIPGVDETLRVNGTAVLSHAPGQLELCRDERRTPKLVIEVSVREVFLHCAKAFMRSKLWSVESQVDRSTLPTMGEMLNDQTGITTPPETQEEMRQRYAPDL